MIVAETTATISLGDASVTNDASAAIIDALASQYNTPAVARMGAAVSVTLYQAISVTITLESDMSDEQLCKVLTAALTLDAFDHTCVATSGGSGTVFRLECPLENNLAAVNAKTAEMRAFISDDAEPLPAAMVVAASSMRRQLASLSVSAVEPPTTSLGALVTIVVQQLAAEASAYAAVAESQKEVMAATGHVDAASISNALAASDALAAVAGLAVAEPTMAVAYTNAPPSVPPPDSPPVPPAPPAPSLLPPPSPPPIVLHPPPPPLLPPPLPPTTLTPLPPSPMPTSRPASPLPPAPLLSLPPSQPPSEWASPPSPTLPPSLDPANDLEIVDDDISSDVFAPEDTGLTTGVVVGGCLLLAAAAGVVYLVARRRGRAAFRSSQRKPSSRGTLDATVTLQAESTERKSEEDKNNPAFVQSTPSLHSVMVQSL